MTEPKRITREAPTDPPREQPKDYFSPQQTYNVSGQPLVYQPQISPPQYADLRRHPRYLVTRPIMAIPVLPDGSPDMDNVLEGITVDISASGIGIEVPVEQPPLGKTMVLGVETDEGSMGFVTATIKYAAECGIGFRLGAQFVPADKDLLRPERVTPTFNAQTYNFTTGLSNDALARWGMLGVVRPMLLDWVQVCYQCQSLLTFRRGCPQCGSARMATSRLIHHFACAHIGYTLDFEGEGCLQCPKCLTKNLVVGTDFEFLDGPYRCMDCSWNGTELERIAQCLRCRVRFPSHRVLEKELIGYHVCRLDPMDFVPDA